MNTRAYGAAELGRGLTHYVFGRAFAAASAIVTVIALVRLMPIAQYAIYTAATAAVALAAALSMLGLDRVAMRFIPIARVAGQPVDLYRFVRGLLGVRVLAIALVMSLCAAAAEPIGGLLQFAGESGAIWPPMLVYMAALALGDCLTFVLQSLMCQERLRRAIAVQWSLRLAFVIAVAFEGLEVQAWHALWAWAISEAIFVAVLWRGVRVSIATSPGSADGGRWQSDRSEIYRTATGNYFGSLAALPWQLYTLRVVAATILPTNELAAYGFFQALIDRIRAYLPAQFLQGIAEPALSSAVAHRRDPRVVSEYFRAVLNVTAWIVVPLVLGVAIAGAPMVDLLTGGKFGEYSMVLAVLLLQILVGTPVVLLWSALNVTGRSAAIARALLLPTLIFYPLLIVAGLRFGALGMAVVGVINVMAVRILMRRGLGAAPFSVGFCGECIVRTAWQSGAALLPIAFVMFAAPPASPWQLLGACILGALIYVLLGLRFPPLNGFQLATLIRMFPWSSRIFNRAGVGTLAEHRPEAARQ